MANKIAPEKTPAIQAFPFEREIEQWKYEAAVSAAKVFVKNFHKSVAELSKILFIAHTALARLGGDRKSENAITYSFSSFCDDIGMSRATAMLYMRLYDPKNDRVRTPEELLAQKRANTPKLVSASETRIAHAMETGRRPTNGSFVSVPKIVALASLQKNGEKIKFAGHVKATAIIFPKRWQTLNSLHDFRLLQKNKRMHNLKSSKPSLIILVPLRNPAHGLPPLTISVLKSAI